jgi:iron complex transport system ATP-binding protein
MTHSVALPGAADWTQPAPLTVSGLSAGYPGRQVIRSLSLEPLRPRQVTGLVGPNAAGKSTLLLALAGLIEAAGEVRLGGRDVLAVSGVERAALITFMPQALPQGVRLTVIESVVAALRASLPLGVRSPDAQHRAVAALERLDIADLALEPLDRLSGGQRQLVGLAQALARNPRVLLLDEPTSALDLRHQVLVMELLRQLAAEDRIVVVVMHDLNLAARWVDHIVVLHEGRVQAEGEPAAAITPGLLARTWGVEARVERSSAGHIQVSVDSARRVPGQLQAASSQAP